jgi:DNA polymerase-3 subunit delta'
LKFSEIYGHQIPKDNLISGIKKGRMPHAQMFIGSEGNNSLPMAIAYAQFISCIDRKENDSCGVCSSCVKYQQMIHPDLHFSFPIYGSTETCDDFIEKFRKVLIENPLLTLGEWFSSLEAENKKPNINIKECRNIIKKLSLKPYESDYKVLIMWLPEYLGKEGNVLLKLIEEPPPNTLFLLVTESPTLILTTIISRTQTTRIPPYTHSNVEHYLNEKGIASGNSAKNAAFISEGNLNMAVQLANNIENAQFDVFRQWLLDCYQGNINKIINEIERYTENGKEGLKLFLKYGMQLVRYALIHKHRDSDNTLGVAESEFIGKLAKFIHMGNAQTIYEAFNHSIFEIDRNGNVKLILINLSLKLKYALKIKESIRSVSQ